MNLRQTNDRSALDKPIQGSLCLTTGLFSWFIGATTLQAATKHAMCTMETDLYNQYKNEPLMADTFKDLEKDARKLGVSPAGPIVPLPNLANLDMGHKISYFGQAIISRMKHRKHPTYNVSLARYLQRNDARQPCLTMGKVEKPGKRWKVGSRMPAK